MAEKMMGIRTGDIVDLLFQESPWQGKSPGQVTQEIFDRVIQKIQLSGEIKEGTLYAIEIF